METRFLVGLLTALLLASGSPVSFASDNSRQQIRFYKVNKQGQTSRIAFTARKARKLECQNFLKKPRVYQARQFGFAYCSLFSKRNCSTQDLVTVSRKKLAEPAEKMTAGYNWFPEGKHARGVRIGSWHCHATD